MKSMELKYSTIYKGRMWISFRMWFTRRALHAFAYIGMSLKSTKVLKNLRPVLEKKLEFRHSSKFELS
jgi:hypothetical protein